MKFDGSNESFTNLRYPATDYNKGESKMGNITALKVNISAEEAEELRKKSEITSLPEDGIYLMDAIDEAVKKGTVSADDMLSGQDMLIAIAEKLEQEGDNPEVRALMVENLRLMSDYATTRLVPIEIP
ncbi:hypothetical protein ABDF71_25460 [Ochrobactrum sp. WV_118_8]